MIKTPNPKYHKEATSLGTKESKFKVTTFSKIILFQAS